MTTSSFPSGSQRFPHLHDFHGAQNIQGISPETPPKRQRQGCLGSQCFFPNVFDDNNSNSTWDPSGNTATKITQHGPNTMQRCSQGEDFCISKAHVDRSLVAAVKNFETAWFLHENDQSIWSSRFLDFQFMPMYLSETKQWCVEIHPLEMFWSTLHHGTWTKVLRPMLSMFFNPSEHISYSTNKQLQ